MQQGKRGVVILAVVLVAVLALAGVGYTALKRGAQEEAATPTQVQTSETEATSDATDDKSDDILLLADYDATVYTELGEPVLLSAIADGKPLVMNFWATWCPYCVEEMPDFAEIYRDYADEVSFAFVDVCDGQRETKQDAQAWLVEQGLVDLPDYYDMDLDAVQTMGIYSYPTTVVVSADGQILAASPGVIDSTSMREALDTLV